MEPISLVIAALLAGFTAGISSSVSTAVTDAYAGLRNVLRQRLERAPGHGPVNVDAVLANPVTGRDQLERMLAAANISPDEQVIEYALRVLRLVDPDGAAAGPNLDLRGAKGVQIGDKNHMTNYFQDGS